MLGGGGLFFNFGCIRLMERSCICEVFQKITRAKLNIRIFGQTTIPKEREEKTNKQTVHINY